MEMDVALTLASIVSFFALVAAWVGLPHTPEAAPAPQSAASAARPTAA